MYNKLTVVMDAMYSSAAAMFYNSTDKFISWLFVISALSSQAIRLDSYTQHQSESAQVQHHAPERPLYPRKYCRHQPRSPAIPFLAKQAGVN